MKQTGMTPTERRASISLAGIYAFRMIGLFLILPVFSLYGATLEHTTPLLIGLAIGVYGLTQVIFQIPFGMLSDRIGRKPIIIIGLILFALGSIVAACADTIYGVILGRALQGSGAIAAVVMALAADLTREEHRTKAMAMIGVTIGISFAISLVLGPVLDKWIGVPGIFWLTSLLALGGIVLLKFGVPDPLKSSFHRDAEPVAEYFSSVLRDQQLLRLDGGIFILHMILTSTFVVIPFAMRDHAGLPPEHHWYIYLPVLLLSMIIMIPLVVVAEKRRQIKEVYVVAILMMGAALAGLTQFYHSIAGLVVSLLFFFIAFNVLEALLPSLIVKFCPAEKKGTAMGVYSTAQFLGAFAGGVAGGSLYGVYGISGVFAFSLAMTVIWLVLAKTMQKPQYLSSYMIKVGDLDRQTAARIESKLITMKGVAEAKINMDDGVAYLKVDSRVADADDLHRVVAEYTQAPIVNPGPSSPGFQQT